MHLVLANLFTRIMQCSYLSNANERNLIYGRKNLLPMCSMKIATTVGDLLQVHLSSAFEVKPVEGNADDINQLSNTTAEPEGDVHSIDKYAAKNLLPTTEALQISGSNESRGLNPFELSTIRWSIFDTPAFHWSEIMRAAA